MSKFYRKKSGINNWGLFAGQDFKKGDKVEFDHEGKTIAGIVSHRGAKFVSVNVRGYSKPWKRNASSLRKI